MTLGKRRRDGGHLPPLIDRHPDPHPDPDRDSDRDGVPDDAPNDGPADSFEPVLKRWWRRHQASLANLAPIGVLGGAHLLGWLLAISQVWLVWAFCWALAAVAAVVIVVARTGGRVWWASAAGVLAWLLLVCAAGAGDELVAALWWCGLARSVPYWRAHQRRWRPGATPEPVAAVGQPAREQLVWARRVVPNNSAYAHTRLDAPEEVPGGFSSIVIGKHGKTEFARMLQAKSTISSAWGVGAAQVALEELVPPDDSRARLTVIARDDLLAMTRFLEDDRAGIDPETGLARVAYYFDGKPAHAQFWTPSGGMQMGLIFGRTESGKTRYAEAKFVLAHRSDRLVTAVLDAQDGQSMPDALRAAGLSSVGVEGVFRGLARLLYVSSRRSQFLATAAWIDEHGRERSGKEYLLPGTELIDPSTGRPFRMAGIWALFDELPLLLNDDEFGKAAVDMLGKGVATMRKAGIGIEGIAQNVGLDYLADQALRSNMAGNVAGFRTESDDDHHMVGLKADPSKLEPYFASTGKPTGGLCYLKGPDARPRAKARGLICRDVYGLTQEPPAGGLDPITAGFLEDYDRIMRQGRDPREPAEVEIGTREPERPTQGDVEAAIEEALADGPLPVDELIAKIGGRVADCTLGQIEAALAALAKAERMWRRGEVCQLLERVGS